MHIMSLLAFVGGGKCPVNIATEISSKGGRNWEDNHHTFGHQTGYWGEIKREMATVAVFDMRRNSSQGLVCSYADASLRYSEGSSTAPSGLFWDF